MRCLLIGLCLMFSSCATIGSLESCECKCNKCIEFCAAKDADEFCRKLLRLKCNCK